MEKERERKKESEGERKWEGEGGREKEIISKAKNSLLKYIIKINRMRVKYNVVYKANQLV